MRANPFKSAILPITACLIGTFVLRMASAVMGSTLQLYFGYIDRHVYALSDTMRGFALALFFLPELVGSPVLGAWSDRYGRKFFMLLGSLSGGIAVFITAVTTDFALLTFTRLLEGLSTASAIPATLGYLSTVTAHSESLRGRVMGLFQIATIGGTIFGILAGGELWDASRGNAFLINALLYAVSLVIFLGVREPRGVHTSSPMSSTMARGWQAFRHSLAYYKTVFSTPAILRFAPAWLSINMVLGIWLNHIVGQVVAPRGNFPNQMLYGIFAHSAQAGSQVSLYATFLMALFGLGVVGWSLVLGKFRRTSVMLIGVGALFLLCTIIFVINHSANFAAPLVLLYLALGAIALIALSGMMPAALTYLADVTETRTADRGAVMGLYTIFFGMGQFLGTLIGGPFADWGAIDGILLISALLGLIATGAIIRLHQVESQPALQTSVIVSKEQ